MAIFDRIALLVFGVVAFLAFWVAIRHEQEHRAAVVEEILIIVVWIAFVAATAWSVQYFIRKGHALSETSASFYNKEFGHKVATEQTIRQLNVELSEAREQIEIKDKFATNLQQTINRWECRFNHKLNGLTVQLAEARQGFPHRIQDTPIVVESVMMTAEVMVAADVTEKALNFISKGKPIPVQWQEFFATDPCLYKTKFITATFSLTKRESNFIHCLVEPSVEGEP